MKKRKISLAPAQDLKELIEIQKLKPKVHYLPLDFGSLLYCKKQKLNHIDPIDFLDNKIHKNGITNQIQIKNNLKKIFKYNNQKKNFIFFLCINFNAFYFVSCLLNAIEAKYKVEKIYLSGWRRKTGIVDGDYYCLTDIFSCLKKFKLTFLYNEEKYSKDKIYSFIPSKNLNVSKKAVFFTDTGYNFKKIIYQLLVFGYRCVILLRKKNNFFKNFILGFLGINYLYLRPNKIKNIKVKKIDIKLNKKFQKFKNYLETRANNYQNTMLNLDEKCKVIDNIISNLKPKKIILNHSINYNSFIIRSSKTKKIPITLIGHGTISKGRNKYETMYQDIISNAIYSKNASVYPIQSKIIYDYLKLKKNTNQPKGNIIFSQVKKQTSKYILYAVTVKNFTNMQFYGQELYYEYLENLKFLNKLAGENKLKIAIKHHPNYMLTNDISSKYFSNLKFLDDPMDKILRKTEILISFSSSSIEDALTSKIPVILLDPWKRYKHTKAEQNFKKKNQCIYYINKKKNLLSAIKTIKVSKKINFDNYVYPYSVKENIIKLINK